MRVMSVALVLFVVGCADAPTEAPYGANVPDVTAPPSSAKKGTTEVVSTAPTAPTASDRTCAAKTCESFQGACGEHDDGCGKRFSCGPCKQVDPSCKPKTCDELATTCGTHDDGCGGTVSCGTCATKCATDAHEPNDTMVAAVDLGGTSDTADKTFTLKNLASADGDEDWFKVSVKDEGWGSNPTIDVTATDAKLEVTAFHVCKSLPNYSYCYYEGTQDNAVGNGCHAMGRVILKTDCNGISEDGETYVRVRKTVSDLSCHSYDLNVFVY